MEKLELENVFIAIVRQYERVIYKVCYCHVSDGFPLVDMEVISRLTLTSLPHYP